MAKKKSTTKKRVRGKKDDTQAKIDSLRSEIVTTKVEIAVGKEKNYSKLRKLKKEMAKYLSEQNKKKDGRQTK